METFKSALELRHSSMAPEPVEEAPDLRAHLVLGDGQAGPAVGQRHEPLEGSAAEAALDAADKALGFPLSKLMFEGPAEELTRTHAIGEQKASHRVIADHLRASGFLVADGVLTLVLAGVHWYWLAVPLWAAIAETSVNRFADHA